MGLASRLPRAERTPAGIVTVIRVDALNGTGGVTISVSPADCQVPGTLGVTLGCGDPAATGAEKVTRTGSRPSARRAPGTGVIDTTRNGPGRVTPGLIRALGGVLPPCVSAYTPAPAISATIAAPIAITRVRGWRATPVPNLAPVATTCRLSSPPLNTPCSPSLSTAARLTLNVTSGLIVVTQSHGGAYPTRPAITHGRRKRKVRHHPSIRIPGVQSAGHAGGQGGEDE